MAVTWIDGYDGQNVGSLIGNINTFASDVIDELSGHSDRLDSIENGFCIFTGDRITESAYSLTTSPSLITILGVSPTISTINGDEDITYSEVTGKFNIVTTGIYRIVPILSMSGANGAIIKLQYSINGTIISASEPDWFMEGATIYQHAMDYSIFEFNAGDYFQIFGVADSARTLNIKKAKFTIERIK